MTDRTVSNTHARLIGVLLMVAGATSLSDATAVEQGVSPMQDQTKQDVRKGRIVHSWDGCTMWMTILNVGYYGADNREIPGDPARFSKKIFEEMIDRSSLRPPRKVNTRNYCMRSKRKRRFRPPAK